MHCKHFVQPALCPFAGFFRIKVMDLATSCIRNHCNLLQQLDSPTSRPLPFAGGLCLPGKVVGLGAAALVWMVSPFFKVFCFAYACGLCSLQFMWYPVSGAGLLGGGGGRTDHLLDSPRRWWGMWNMVTLALLCLLSCQFWVVCPFSLRMISPLQKEAVQVRHSNPSISGVRCSHVRLEVLFYGFLGTFRSIPYSLRISSLGWHGGMLWSEIVEMLMELLRRCYQTTALLDVSRLQ